MDATLNCSNRLDTDGHLNACIGRPNGSLGFDFSDFGICTESSLNFLKHISKMKTEINGIPDKLATL
jgi:hypothetical protein